MKKDGRIVEASLLEVLSVGQTESCSDGRGHAQFSSVTQSCPTLCDPMNCSTAGLPVHHHLPEFTQTHIHRVSDAIQPSHPLLSPSPSTHNPSQHQSLFQPKIKSDTVSPSISHEVIGPDAMIFVFQMLSFKPNFSLSSFHFSAVIPCCCCSVAQSCLILCDPMDCSMPVLHVPHHLQKFAQVHV